VQNKYSYPILVGKFFQECIKMSIKCSLYCENNYSTNEIRKRLLEKRTLTAKWDYENGCFDNEYGTEGVHNFTKMH